MAQDAASGTPLLNEADRPRAVRHPAAEIGPQGRAQQRMLVQIHNHLRHELEQIRDAVAAVVDGRQDAATARSMINTLTVRQNYWSLGAFCAAYCRILTLHHTIEDEHMFASLRRADGGLGPVLDRLAHEHEIIAAVLTRLDAALVAMVTDDSTIEVVRAAVQDLGEALLSHLAYEEEELLEPIGRLNVAI